MFKTRITDLFGIEYPIVQGGMMWLARAELVAAISNAGGLGILHAFMHDPPAGLVDEIKKTRKLTDRPFGVNITLMPTLRSVNIDAYLDIVIGEGVKIVETAGRSPEPYMERLKAAGVKVIHKCTAVRFARTAQKIGCDVISMDGFECGGHPGEEDVTSLILVPLTADAVEIPIIASGGFGDGRGLVAALALGADGINMGTRFVATQECPAHPRVKEWLMQASERDTLLAERSFRNSVRVLRNKVSEEVLEMESRGTTLEEVAPLITGKRGKELLETGKLDEGMLACGQIVGLIRDIPTVKHLIQTIISEAEEVVSLVASKGVFQPLRKPLL